MLQGIDDLEYFMGWENTQKPDAVQSSLFIELNEEEEKIVDLLRSKKELFIDEIAAATQLSISKTSSFLLNLEFKNVLCALPGSMYKLK